MAEQTETYDPSEHTVDEVNAHLDEHPDQTGAVLDAETEGQARKGILEGPHATPADEPTDETDAPAKPELQARTLEDEGKRVPEAEGEAYQQGYAGFSPARDKGEDLTLQAVLKDA